MYLFLFYKDLFNVLSLVYTIRATVGSFQKNLPIAFDIILLIAAFLAFTNVIFIYINLFLSYPVRVLKWVKLYTKLETICFRLPLLIIVNILYFTLPSMKSKEVTQTSITMFFALGFVVISIISQILDIIFNKDNAKLNKEQRLLLFAIISVFIPLFIGSAVFTAIEPMSFETAWNFVNVSALTVGYGNTVLNDVAGKIFLITFGNIMLICAGILLVAIRMIIPVTKFSPFYFALLLILYWNVGAIVFMFLEIKENWGFLNSLYFTWVSFTTIGYGDFYPTTPWSWEFWLLYMYIAIGFVSYFLGLIMDTIQKIIQ